MVKGMNVENEINKIASFIRNVFRDSKANGVAVGLSGGIDSSTTAALCTRAIGKENVVGFILPCYSEDQDQNDALLVIKYLDIEYKIIDLSKIYDTYIELMPKDQELTELAKANLKPRIRMSTLYFFANQMNYLVTGTTNKSEQLVGYFTKYGDVADFYPIKHLYKKYVRLIAQFLRLPPKILNRTSTAGLWAGQTTEGEISEQLGFDITYKTLDDMLEHLEKQDFDTMDDRYQKLFALVQKNVHKSLLAPALEGI
jgi:NAD+ synthase